MDTEIENTILFTLFEDVVPTGKSIKHIDDVCAEVINYF